MKSKFILLAILVVLIGSVLATASPVQKVNDPPVIEIFDTWGMGTSVEVDLAVYDENPSGLTCWFTVPDPNAPGGYSYYFCMDPDWTIEVDGGYFLGNVPLPYAYTDYITFTAWDGVNMVHETINVPY